MLEKIKRVGNAVLNAEYDGIMWIWDHKSELVIAGSAILLANGLFERTLNQHKVVVSINDLPEPFSEALENYGNKE